MNCHIPGLICCRIDLCGMFLAIWYVQNVLLTKNVMYLSSSVTLDRTVPNASS